MGMEQQLKKVEGRVLLNSFSLFYFENHVNVLLIKKMKQF
jgi:hypothetical protein